MLAKNETKKHGNLETSFRRNMKQADFLGFSKFSFGTLFDPCCNFRTFCNRFQNAFYFRRVVSFWELGKYREQITYGKKCEIQEGGILQQTTNQKRFQKFLYIQWCIYANWRPWQSLNVRTFQ